MLKNTSFFVISEKVYVFLQIPIVFVLYYRWVDEVIPDAPWVVNQEFVDKHNIDFIAHDSLPWV